jgi:hypothetical protein
LQLGSFGFAFDNVAQTAQDRLGTATDISQRRRTNRIEEEGTLVGKASASRL